MNAAVYARKSTEQTGVAAEARSVTRQIENAKAYAKTKGWTISDEHIYADDGVSGAEFVKRPGFLRLMNALKPRPPFQVLIMSEESRLGREAIQVGYAFKQIVDAGVRIFSYLTNQERTLDSATDKMLLALTNFASEFEREKASQRTHDAMLRKAKSLYVTGNKIYGYDNLPVYGSDRNADGTLRRQHVVRKINLEQSRVVGQIFEHYATGCGLATIAKTLNEARVPPPMGGSLGWCPTAIREILRRDLYRGIVWWNRTQTIQRDGTRKRRQRPQSDWLRLEAPELRIVSDALWAQVEALRQRNAAAYQREGQGRFVSRPTGEDQRSAYLLSSIAKCGRCGGSIVAISKGRHGRSGQTIYRCSYFHKRGTSICRNAVSIRQELLDAAVLNAMNEAIDGRVISASIGRALEKIKAQQVHFPDRRSAVVRELSQIETRLQHLVELIATGQGTPTVIQSLHREEERKVNLTTELAQLQTVTTTLSLDEQRIAKRLRDAIGNLPALLGRHVPLARQILRTLLDGHIRCEPIEEDQRPGYRFTATGTFGRLLTGTSVVNAGGGGEGS
jgi:site-specific DNA recombinase